jgi:hypothetical protein
MSTRSWEIYTLTDPRTLRARYVGVTFRPDVRYKEHLWHASNGKTYLYNWIRGLLNLGFKPIYLVLEYGQGGGWQDRERFWIATHRKFCHLVNGTDGGDGVSGRPLSPEHRAKIAKSHRGRAILSLRGKALSPEHRAKMSAASKGKSKSPEHRAKACAQLVIARQKRWQMERSK